MSNACPICGSSDLRPVPYDRMPEVDHKAVQSAEDLRRLVNLDGATGVWAEQIEALRMIRDNSARVEFLGMNVRAYRLAAFVIASAFASIAGALMSLYVSAAYPNFAYWTMSGEGIFVIMLGGLNTFLGPLVGAGILTLLNHFVTEHTKYYGLVLGVIILFYVLALRKGLLDILVERFQASRSQRIKSKSH